ncbi:hypothetical protein ID866_10397 [Astraeus odoratus]|nr:hypothetical protein ID866_10397 [Astraeus odoratus]
MDTHSFLTQAYDNMLLVARSVTVLDAAAVIAVLWALRAAIRAARKSLRTTRLRALPRTGFMWGASKQLFESTDPGSIYEAWANEYGPAYEVPTTFGGNKMVLCDAKAIAHFYSRDTWTYIHTDSSRHFTERNFGKGILWAQGEVHKRQRKSLTPAFSHAAIRNISHVFFNSAYKTKAAWESLIDESDGSSAIIEVQNWMNHISLDTIGLAGFSHDFGSLDGKPASITNVFDTFGASPKRSTVNVGLFLLAQVFPILARIPTSRSKLFAEMQQTMRDISVKLLERTKREKEEGVLDGKEEKSIIGVLVKAKDADSDLHLTTEEVLAQASKINLVNILMLNFLQKMRVLLVAGYETTSISMTWALLELARNPHIQSKLREELIAFGGEPTYDQLNNGLPYLDGVVHEILRLYPALNIIDRVAAEDDIIPLSEPVRTKSGEVVDHISVAAGTHIRIPISCINRSISVWGPDAKVFRPERWLTEDGIPKKAQEVQGHRHLLTFIDGPRTCLGKGFAVAEFKVCIMPIVLQKAGALTAAP